MWQNVKSIPKDKKLNDAVWGNAAFSPEIKVKSHLDGLNEGPEIEGS